jgi:rRNA maturation endonuclease Nob1
VPFEIKPEELAAKGREYGMFWCISCKKTFMKKGAIECPICGSKKNKAEGAVAKIWAYTLNVEYIQ